MSKIIKFAVPGEALDADTAGNGSVFWCTGVASMMLRTWGAIFFVGGAFVLPFAFFVELSFAAAATSAVLLVSGVAGYVTAYLLGGVSTSRDVTEELRQLRALRKEGKLSRREYRRARRLIRSAEKRLAVLRSARGKVASALDARSSLDSATVSDLLDRDDALEGEIHSLRRDLIGFAGRAVNDGLVTDRAYSAAMDAMLVSRRALMSADADMFRAVAEHKVQFPQLRAVK